MKTYLTDNMRETSTQTSQKCTKNDKDALAQSAFASSTATVYPIQILHGSSGISSSNKNSKVEQQSKISPTKIQEWVNIHFVVKYSFSFLLVIDSFMKMFECLDDSVLSTGLDISSIQPNRSLLSVFCQSLEPSELLTPLHFRNVYYVS